VKQLTDVPVVPPDAPGDYDWFPLQHHFGLTTTGISAPAILATTRRAWCGTA
jgi:hypothetical protein